MDIRETPKPDYIETKGENVYFKTQKVINTIDIYLSEKVTESWTYTRIAQELRSAGQLDIINFYISSFGGSCHGLMTLITAIAACKAKEINMIVTSPSYSAGATLALAGTSLILEDYTFLMFHNYSSGPQGKGGELVKGVLESDKWLKQYFKALHSPFLTGSEVKNMEKDQDVYVHFDEKGLSERIRRHFVFHNKKRNFKFDLTQS